MESEKCKICDNSFRPNALKEGKCPLCQVEHPNANSREEILSKIKVPNKMGDELTELRVKEIVGEMLETRITPVLEKLDSIWKGEAKLKRVESKTPQQSDKVKRGPGRPKKETTNG